MTHEAPRSPEMLKSYKKMTRWYPALEPEENAGSAVTTEAVAAFEDDDRAAGFPYYIRDEDVEVVPPVDESLFRRSQFSGRWSDWVTDRAPELRPRERRADLLAFPVDAESATREDESAPRVSKPTARKGRSILSRVKSVRPPKDSADAAVASDPAGSYEHDGEAFPDADELDAPGGEELPDTDQSRARGDEAVSNKSRSRGDDVVPDKSRARDDEMYSEMDESPGRADRPLRTVSDSSDDSPFPNAHISFAPDEDMDPSEGNFARGRDPFEDADERPARRGKRGAGARAGKRVPRAESARDAEIFATPDNSDAERAADAAAASATFRRRRIVALVAVVIAVLLLALAGGFALYVLHSHGGTAQSVGTMVVDGRTTTAGIPAG